MKKRCTKCGIEKMLAEFVKHKRYKDGYYSRCKECSYAIAKEWSANNQEIRRELRTKYRKRNREKIREMDRDYYLKNHEKRLETARKAQSKYYRTEKGKKKYEEQSKLLRERYPEKYRARSLLSNAIVDGILIKPSKCSLCGSDEYAIQGHHPDYSKPLEVIWVCQPCHGIVHRRIKFHRDRLSEETSKDDATVKTCEETAREESEEVLPPLKNGQ